MNPSYNGFRAFAFFGVFLYHAFDGENAGFLGVQAFFVLSGFLITPILLKTKSTFPGFSGYYKNFLIRRTLRIFPLAWFYIIALFLGIYLLGLARFDYFASLLVHLRYAFTYVYNFFHVRADFTYNAFISHFWSLAVEEQFYLFWPLLIFLLPGARVKKALLFFIMAGPLFRLCIAYYTEAINPDFLFDEGAIVVYFSTLSHLDAFATGAFCALFVQSKLRNRHVLGMFLFVYLLGVCFEWRNTESVQFWNLGYPPFLKDSYKYIWGYTLLNICFGLVLVKMKSRTFFPRIFEHKWITYLGKISYGLYVYHAGILISVKHGLPYLPAPFQDLIPLLTPWVPVFALILSILVSDISYRLLEERFIRLKDIWAPKELPSR